MSRSWLVVGGGASGIAAAHALWARGEHVEIIERATVLGGRAYTASLGERRVVLGGKNIGRRYRRFRGFLTAMGAPTFEPFGLNSSRVVDGRLETVDSGRPIHAAAGIARHGGLRGAMRLARLARLVRGDEDRRHLGSPDYARAVRRHAGTSVEAHLGQRLSDLIARPLTVRTNGAEPDEVPLANFNTNLAMLLDSYDQLTNGLEPVWQRFAARVPCQLGEEAHALVVRDGRVAGIRTRTIDGIERERACDELVIAAPAPIAAALVEPLLPGLAAHLLAVRYFPAGVVVAEYETDVFPERTRAIVFDARQPLSNAGAYGREDRATVRYTFSGAAARALLSRGPSSEQLLAVGEPLLAEHFPVDTRRRVAATGQMWERAYCAASEDQASLLEAIGAARRELAGLRLCGDYVRGASLEACWRAGEEAVSDG